MSAIDTQPNDPVQAAVPSEASSSRLMDSELNQRRAYFVHRSSSLEDSIILVVAANGSDITTISVENDLWQWETRTLGQGFGALDAEDVLAGFCQRILLGITTTRPTLLLASALTHHLFKAYDGTRAFSCMNLPFGIQGIQELDWKKQNDELFALRRALKKRVLEEGSQVVHEKHFDDKGNELLWMSFYVPFLSVIDRSMLKDRGLVKYQFHVFKTELPWELVAFQMFVNVESPAFKREFVKKDPYRDMAVITMMAIRMFAAAREHQKWRANRHEAAVLIENIKRTEFYNKSLIKESRTEHAVQSLEALLRKKNGSAEASTPDLSACTPSASRSSPTHSDSATLPPSPGQTDNEEMGGHAGDKARQPKKTKRGKKGKKGKKTDRTSDNAQNKGCSQPLQHPQEASSDPVPTPLLERGPELGNIAPDLASNSEEGGKIQAEASPEVGVPARNIDLGDTQNATAQEVAPSSKEKPSVAKPAVEGQAKKDGRYEAQEGDEEKQTASSPGVDDVNEASKALRSVRFEDSDDTGVNATTPTAATAPNASTVAPFKFDSMDPRLRCDLPDCRRMTSCWDPATVICPACGPDSYVRYCTKEHLFEDIQRHWVMDCEKARIPGPIDHNTVRSSQTPHRAYTRNQRHNLVERHRQAVYRAMSESDYFIFNDIDMVDPVIDQPTKEQWNAVRGTGQVVLQLVLPDDLTPQSRRRLFEHHILQCLMFGDPLAHASCMMAFQLIRETLIISGHWTEEILTYLCMQVAGEWGGFKVPEQFYNVQEVNRMWQERGLLPMLPTE
ncbi:hypothetical protein HRR90_004790 [Exophiala dermatitidis]|uniref:Uncharacterized protein n=1 Tax=Exophiala dermatitidis TaxID=5970 RepID=A0AAN6EXE6_EXODE|nr:hypothetical protein HRR74_004785 [Exophiala dermatitidis]KAJ4534410.1 hypothetical protein HRR76_006335 [Exophiala dermatitidis]KAJ4564086.1 hypothetical protein HRR79_006112 [Exophiala dermatitidis]KAJ4573328.1 hypothetical protein HRR81_004815 [Exophiala dermatitidis]KAJ4595295.1 hypothetical protein HRR84_005502 [Exophiala dermatitidis]